MTDVPPVLVRALVLLSGGLDSQLAICVLREQGIHVEGIVFNSPFYNVEPAKAAAKRLDIRLHVIDFTAEIVALVNDPPHGFGSCMNPCIDCHARMVRRAGEICDEMGFDFVATGEVLNQRPMSQNRRSLATVSNDSGEISRLLRPLSALLLDETEVERRGLVDRSRLLDLNGRSRKRQFELATRFGLHDYPSPAGGCRLTEPHFSARLRDLKSHEGLDGVRNITLLRYGRHFRLASGLKLVVGRNEADNAMIEGLAELYDLVLTLEGIPGPTGLLPCTALQEDVCRAGAICARYCGLPKGQEVTLRVRSSRGVKTLNVCAASPEEASALLV